MANTLKGENAMSIQTQAHKFAAVILQNLPEVTEDVMQGWIENPKALQKLLAGLVPSDNGSATIVRACFRLALDKAFNTAEFIGKDWSVWRGQVDGNGLEGDEDSVPEPDIVDFQEIVLETHLQEGETKVHGEKKMRRARTGSNQQLGGRAFLALWNDWLACKVAGKPEDSVLEKLRMAEKIGNVIYFFGLTLRGPRGDRDVLGLCFSGKVWFWDYRWLGDRWLGGSPSVSLASVK
jgi:hypothetical protein